MSYAKPWTGIEDQLATLVARGLQVTDNAKALDYLQRIGYYRLSGYWYPFRRRDVITHTVTDDFKHGATHSKCGGFVCF